MPAAGSPCFFPFTETLARRLAQFLYARGLPLGRVYQFLLILGLLAPAPLYFFEDLHGSHLSLLSPLLFGLFVLLDCSLPFLETLHGRRSRLRAVFPFSPSLPAFIYYLLVFVEMVYAREGDPFVRYLNFFMLFCLVGWLLLLHAFLKLKGHRPAVHEFAGLLARVAEGPRRSPGARVLSLLFRPAKKDLLAVALLAASFLDVWVVYSLVCATAAGFLLLTLGAVLFLRLPSSRELRETVPPAMPGPQPTG